MGLNRYIHVEEVSAFKLVVRKTNTLVGLAPLTDTYAAPGGGRKRFDRDLIETANRETEEECGRQMQTVWASPLPEMFYMDKDSRQVVSVQKAFGLSHLKLHVYLLAVEVGGGQPRECEPDKFQAPTFQPPAFFKDNKHKLRPSLAHALGLFRQRCGWPNISVPAKWQDINTGYMRHVLASDMHLAPQQLNMLFRKKMETA